MRQRIVLYIVLMVVFLSASSCGKSNHLKVEESVRDMMKEEKLEHCYITSIGDYKSFKVHLYTPQVSEEEYELNFVEEAGENVDAGYIEKLGFDSIEDYRNDVDKKYMEHLKIQRILSARAEIINFLLGTARFELDESEVAEFSKRMVYQEQNYSLLFGYDSFEDYLSEELQMTEKQFLQKCYDDAELEIKKCLIIGAIAEKESISILLGEDLYDTYQNIENAVYDLFMEPDSDF